MREPHRPPDAGDEDATDEASRRVIRSRLRPAPAPAKLRARIEAMLAAERGRPD